MGRACERNTFFRKHAHFIVANMGGDRLAHRSTIDAAKGSHPFIELGTQPEALHAVGPSFQPKPHFVKAADQSCRLEEGCSSARRAPSSCNDSSSSPQQSAGYEGL